MKKKSRFIYGNKSKKKFSERLEMWNSKQGGKLIQFRFLEKKIGYEEK